MAKENKSAPKKGQKKGVKKAGKAKGKKKWVPIFAPKSFDGIPLGETHVENADSAVGKSITANLMNLTGDMRKQGVEIRFDVVKVQEGKAYCAVTGYELLPSMMKRIVRRGRSKVSDSFIVRTATGRLVRIKPIIITANHASGGACTAMRLATRQRIKQLIKSMSFDRLVQDLINFKVQRAVKDEVNKTHPVKGVEIKACFLLPEGTSEKREIREDSREEDFVEVKEASPETENEKESLKSDDEGDDAAGDGEKADDASDDVIKEETDAASGEDDAKEEKA